MRADASERPGESRASRGAAASPAADAQLRRSFIIIHMAGPLLGLIIPALLAGVDSTPDAVVPVLTIGICLFWLFPLMTRWSATLDGPATGSVQLLVFLSLFGCYHYGGLTSPFTVWLIVAVLLSFLYVQRGLGWCFAGAAAQIALFVAAYELVPPPTRIEDGHLDLISAASILAAALYISLIAALYSRIKVEGSALAEAMRVQQGHVLRLRAQVGRAEADMREIAGLLQDVSHELRTSLNVVLGYSEMLAEDAAIDESVDAQQLLQEISQSSRSLLGIVDDIAVGAERKGAAGPTAPAETIATDATLRPGGWRAAANIVLGALQRLSRRPGLGLSEDGRDRITGLANRADFLARAERALASAAGQPAALLVADINGFKEINDSWGHDAGDQVLRIVAERLIACTPAGIALARLGGDTFAAICFGDDAEATMTGLAETFTDAVSRPIDIADEFLTPTLSVGLAGAADRIGGRELLRRAEVAMHRAKQDERTPIQAFAPHMDEALRFRRTIRQDLATAIATDQFDLVLQPVVDARSGAMASAEALLRWPHPVLGFVSPAKLIPLAEESGQIIAIDEWVLERALSYAARLERLPIAVNISPVQFRHPGFARRIVDRLAAHGVQPSLIRLEITEGVLVTHTKAAARAVSELREAGIKIALDDFGTGFSSLSYLKDLPFDLLKIDRSFVSELDKGSQGGALLRAIVELGHSLGMSVVAEGVETAGQASAVQLLGCDFIQGYFTGRPAGIEAIELQLRTPGTLRKASAG